MSDGDERGRTLQGIAVCVAAVMLPAAIYVGSYLALLQPIESYTIHDRDSPRVFMCRTPLFSYGGTTAETIFWPLTQFDMLVRPGYWGSVRPDTTDR